MKRSSVAERILQGFGVDDPRDIDLEAIAWELGAEVRYGPLDSCEARIIGFGGRAIITVDQSRRPARRRFSVGHELGHWQHHRGRSSICRSDDIGNEGRSSTNPERIADAFAADLLMPEYLFRPRAARLKRATFAAVDELADVFQTSRTATALRVVSIGPAPAMIVCHGPNGRRWFRRGPDIPDHWFPRDELDAQSNAMEVLHGGSDRPEPFLIGADAWFDRRDAEQYELYEQTIRMTNGDALTLLDFRSDGMLG